MKKAVIAMSGGVDSSVAALLMKNEGYDCVGATMQLYIEGDCSDAKAVADKLNMPFYIYPLKEEFKQLVIDKFIEYMADGRSEGVSLDEVGKEFGKLINHNIARKIWADYESGALEVNDDGIFEPKKETKEKPDFDVEAYKKSKKKLEDTIADIDKKIQLYDSNPTPNGLKMAQQLENQKKEWQKQLENLEAQKKDYKKSVLGESLLLEGIEEQKEDEEEFLLDNILEEDIDDMAKEKEEESLFNDYTAEQPGLFNSTAMKVREAMNRCNIL